MTLETATECSLQPDIRSKELYSLKKGKQAYMPKVWRGNSHFLWLYHGERQNRIKGKQQSFKKTQTDSSPNSAM